MLLLLSADFFHNFLFQKIITEKLSECQTVCKGYQQTTKFAATVLPAKKYSDIMFCLQVIRGLESTDRLNINPSLIQK